METRGVVAHLDPPVTDRCMTHEDFVSAPHDVKYISYLDCWEVVAGKQRIGGAGGGDGGQGLESSHAAVVAVEGTGN